MKQALNIYGYFLNICICITQSKLHIFIRELNSKMINKYNNINNSM